MRPFLATLFCVFALAASAGPAVAFDCGKPPPLANESSKLEIGANANLAIRNIAGGANFSLKKSRTEILSKYPNADRALVDNWYEYDACVAANDPHWTKEQRLRIFEQVHKDLSVPLSALRLKSKPGPSVIGASQSTQNCQTGSNCSHDGPGSTSIGTLINLANSPPPCPPGMVHGAELAPPPGIQNIGGSVGQQTAEGPGAIQNVCTKVGAQFASMNGAAPNLTGATTPKLDAFGNPCKVTYETVISDHNVIINNSQAEVAPFSPPAGVCIGYEEATDNYTYHAAALNNDHNMIGEQSSKDNHSLEGQPNPMDADKKQLEGAAHPHP